MPEQPFESVEDFLQDLRFQQWARGEAPGDKRYWQAFLNSNPDKVHLYEEAIALILIMQGNDLQPVNSSRKIRQIQDAIADKVTEKRILPVWQWLRWGLAAMLVVAVGFWWSNRTTNKTAEVAATEKFIPALKQSVTRRNERTQAMLVNLPDGSSVLLSKESSVRYNQQMNGKKRVVYLTGEGFFEVVKDANRPFFVYADKVVTKVLGTSFTVKSYPDSAEAIVSVKTGKVSVSTAAQNAGSHTSLTLLPNQQVNLLVENQKLTTTITEVVKPSEMTPVQKEPFEFEFTPVAEAFKILEANYAVKIHFDEVKMRDCTLTASLKDEPFLEKIRLICLATESSFQVLEDQIIISGNGCQTP
ncbi:hypothetical protein DYBT9623_01328 [Dyadobacter sp. CECT 9623]|uniref:FecR family protein n=1 Tax=Dyadobacter linearis TaxID=2823330 RepID=A0ABM8UMA0_9BACT|nr:FecR family protein [Dyadobacter sp. CECT 9623]CAG5068596.1 hypothetical protein DYBT9623_01328 [Dyadobacter sp. CECT 9623]